MKPLIVIPARGGSKGVPRKNIKLLNGKPLIHYTIDAAREVFEDRLIFVSTEDAEIKTWVEKAGLKVPTLRPKELASDSSGTYEVLLHAIDFTESQGYYPDTLILLQPTSPFRKSKHISEAVANFDQACEMLVSVKKTSSNPYYVLFEEDKNGFLRRSKLGSFSRRQDCPEVWELNGAIYIIHIPILKKKTLSEFTEVKKFVMDEISSHDIDTFFDWKVAEVIARDQESTE